MVVLQVFLLFLYFVYGALLLVSAPHNILGQSCRGSCDTNRDMLFSFLFLITLCNCRPPPIPRRSVSNGCPNPRPSLPQRCVIRACNLPGRSLPPPPPQRWLEHPVYIHSGIIIPPLSWETFLQPLHSPTCARVACEQAHPFFNKICDLLF